MSVDKDLMFLAEFLEQCYVIPYTHDELLDLLSRIKNGYFLSREEYETLKGIILNDEDIEGDFLFSGDYNDLTNKPYIPKKLSEMTDYNTFMSVINSTWAELKSKDSEIEEKISDNARFVSALEVVLTQDVQRLEQLINACTLFEGETLEDVIGHIKDELGWLEHIKEDLDKGKVLSEKDFTTAYEEILKSINETTNGLTGYIKKVIAESIVEPGEPNGNGVYRLDSIGEALATKVDKVYGYDLSQNDFANKYREMLDAVLNANGNGNGTIQDYIVDVVSRYEEEFQHMINDVSDRIVEYTENEIQRIDKKVADKFVEIDQEMSATKEETLFGVTFKEGDGPASISLGGLQKGTNLEGRQIREVLLEILCPFVGPSISASLELAPHCNYLARIGSVVEVRGIVADISKGSLPIVRTTFKKLIGSQYETIYSYNGVAPSYYFSNIYEVTQSVDSSYFIVEVEDSGGHVSVSETQSIEIVYPIFYGVADADSDLTSSEIGQLYELLKFSGSDCEIRYTTQNQRMVFAVPAGYGTLASILDQNGYDITKSFEHKTVTMTFYVKEAYGDIVKENKYERQYYVYYNNPSTVNGFEIIYSFR